MCRALGNLQCGLCSCRTVSHGTLQLQQVSLHLPTESQLSLSESRKNAGWLLWALEEIHKMPQTFLF